jgi:hypothetical protein
MPVQCSAGPSSATPLMAYRLMFLNLVSIVTSFVIERFAPPSMCTRIGFVRYVLNIFSFCNLFIMVCVVLSSSAYIGSSVVWGVEASVMLSSHFMSVMFLVWFDRLIGGGVKHLYGAMLRLSYASSSICLIVFCSQLGAGSNSMVEVSLIVRHRIFPDRHSSDVVDASSSVSENDVVMHWSQIASACST